MSGTARPDRRHDGRRHDPETATAAAALAGLADVEGPILVVCDFDGTLAAIHPDPAGATLAPGGPRGRCATSAGSPARGRTASPWRSSPAGRRSTSPAASGSAASTYLGDHGLQGRDAAAAACRPSACRSAHAARHADHASASRRLGDEVGRLLADADVAVRRAEGPVGRLPLPDGRRPRRGPGPDPGGARGGPRGPAGRAPRDALRPPRDVADRRGPARGTPARRARPSSELVARHRPAAVAVLGDDRTDAEAFRVVRRRPGRRAPRRPRWRSACAGARTRRPRSRAAPTCCSRGRRAVGRGAARPGAGASRRGRDPGPTRARAADSPASAPRRAGRRRYGSAVASASAARPTLSRNGVGKSPRTTVMTAVTASPRRRSAPWPTGAGSACGSRMYM